LKSRSARTDGSTAAGAFDEAAAVAWEAAAVRRARAGRPAEDARFFRFRTAIAVVGSTLEYSWFASVRQDWQEQNVSGFECIREKPGGEYFALMRGKALRPLVLVVDDEPLIRWSLSEGLAEAGYPVQLAANGAEARMAIAAAAAPLIVILDLRLPDVNDMSLLRHIRTSRPDVPVLMMTAHGSSEDMQQAANLGAFRFVAKPFDVTEMIGLVDAASASAR
jgi:CheY-like chemotaxis protein